MVGILLMTHQPLASAFIQAAQHVFRSMPERLEAIDVIADQNIAEVQSLACAAVSRLNDGDGVLILTDIMGGTPANCCLKLPAESNLAVIAGISLPMLLRAINYRHEKLDVVVEMALAGGQNGAIRVDNLVSLD